MSVAHHAPGTDAARLRQRGLRVTGPRLAILAMLEEVGGHRSADELVLALRRAGYHHARTTVYNALDDLARAKLVRAAPVDAGALRYETSGDEHHHFVCRSCGVIHNVAVDTDLAARPLPTIEGGEADELDVVYRGLCARCASQDRHIHDRSIQDHQSEDRRGEDRQPAMVGGGRNGAASISGDSSSTVAVGQILDLRGR